jgi:hypothetical protein
MKKSLLFLFALGAGLSLPHGEAAAFDLVDWLASVFDQPAEKAQDRRDPSPQALCKQIEVPVDEGYGISRRETRRVCDQAR